MMISPRDPVVDTGSRSRNAILQERKLAKAAEASEKWSGALSPRTVQQNIYHADAVNAASAYMHRLLNQTATASDARAAGVVFDRDAAPASGMKASAAKDAMCTTYYSSVSSKKMDPHRSRAEAHPAWEHTDSPRAAPSSNKSTPRPALPGKVRKSMPLPPTIGRDAIVAGTPNPPHFPMHRMYIRRPEVTTLDSYDVPVYSSFSGDKAFHPEMDDALRSQRERRWRRRREELRKLKERDAHHREVALEFTATLQRVRELKADARAAQVIVSILPEDGCPADTQGKVEGGDGSATTQITTVPVYDPHRLMQASKTPRSAVPSRPADAMIRAAANTAAATTDGGDSNADVTTNAANTNLLAGKLHHHADILNAAMAATSGFTTALQRRPVSATIGRQSPPPRRVLSPAAAAAAQALEFKFSPRPPSAAQQRTEEHGPAAASRAAAGTPSGPLAVTAAGMDLFALTRVHSSTSYAAGPTPTPPPASALNRTRPWSAQTSRRVRPGSAQAMARCSTAVDDAIATPGAPATSVIIAANRRPHSARASLVAGTFSAPAALSVAAEE